MSRQWRRCRDLGLCLLAALSGLLASGCGSMPTSTSPERAVLDHYAIMALAKFEDAQAQAEALDTAVQRLINDPTEDSLAQARQAWRAARVPYQQTETYRFANPVIDNWEGRVNAWPLDEGLIDYVAGNQDWVSYENPHATVNVIANPQFRLSGETVDARVIDEALLVDTLHQIDRIEANVAIGYHAVEFLLWGQDLNGTGPGAGARPATDYNLGSCTGGNCERRAAYLRVVTRLLVDELTWMRAQWQPGGAARARLDTADVAEGLAIMLTGMERFALGELAGERMELGLMLRDPEEEHDCFSDNTHWSHYYNVLGMQNVYLGRYRRINGTLIEGASLSALLQARDASLDRAIKDAFDRAMAAVQAIVDSAERDGVAYDQLLGGHEGRGQELILAAIQALTELAGHLDQARQVLGVDAIFVPPPSMAT